MEFVFRPRKDFIIKPLTVNDVKEVDNFWSYKSPGSAYTISRNIKYNLSLGAYHPESGELCAWVLQYVHRIKLNKQTYNFYHF